MQVIEGSYTVPSGRIGIVVSRFNELVVDGLLKGALGALERQGVSLKNIDVVRVPGAAEIPVVCDRLLSTGKYSGLIALGCVIRGATAHFEMVANACTGGIAQTALKYQKPVMHGVLTTNTVEEALARAGLTVGNKGTEAALGLMEMCHVLDAIV